MRPDLIAPPQSAYRKRTLSVLLYPITETPAELLAGTATGSTNITNHVISLSQTDTGATMRLDLPSTVTAPVPGQCVQVTDTISAVVYTVFNLVIEAVSSDRDRGGGDTLTLTLRRRDAHPMWRQVRRVSAAYPVGAQLARIARDVCTSAGLGATEVDLPDFGLTVGAGQAQLSDLTLWDMLGQTLAPGLLEPFVDARGLLKAISRNVQREPDITVPDAQVVRIGAATARPGVTGIRVRYVDPVLARVVQDERVLSTQNAVVGFFNTRDARDIWFSDDRRTRALGNTYMRIVKSVNGEGWLNHVVADQSWVQTSPFGGRITVNVNYLDSAVDFFTNAGGLAGAGAAIGAIFGGALGAIMGAVGGLLQTLASVGTGTYEIHGQVYDYVQVVHLVEMYDSGATAWQEQVEDFESTLVPTEAAAIAIGTMELLYRVRSAKGAQLTLIDDYRIEPGDLLGLSDGTKFYVQSLTRDLTRGAPAHVQLGGFLT